MITSADWAKLVYRYPKLHGSGAPITYMIGLDTEAYTTGEPFMVCMSDGTEYDPHEMPSPLLTKYNGEHIAVYNLKYDSGALLYHMPTEAKLELWVKNECRWPQPKGKSIRVEYIPHKMLRFSLGKDYSVSIWDVSQYYSMSLDRAAEKYIGRRKLDMETKRFTPRFVKLHHAKLHDYCVRDARLCADLGTFLVTKLDQFGIRATALYSSASLSWRYFADRCRIVTSWRFFKHYPDAMKAAMDSYEGGKFEVTARGAFTGYEYDLVSAYPCEIADLADITFAKVARSTDYIGEAQYAFLRCKVTNGVSAHVPCGLMQRGVRVYPTGEYFATLTKAEYDYLTALGVGVQILDGYWLVLPSVSRPYAETVAELFRVKALYKGKDPMLYEVSKRMLNSWYGKTVQCIQDWRDRFVAGPGFNPFFGAIITANVRIKVSKIQNALREKCLAVHTDSVITTEPLDKELVTDTLGNFGFVEEGKGILIACGQYAMGDKEAYKGFEPRDGDTWEKLLTENAGAYAFPYPVLRVESWVEAMAKGHYDRVNLFADTQKMIDLNGDTKRTWLRRVRGRDLLGPLEQSEHRVTLETNPPEHWRL